MKYTASPRSLSPDRSPLQYSRVTVLIATTCGSFTKCSHTPCSVSPRREPPSRTAGPDLRCGRFRSVTGWTQYLSGLERRRPQRGDGDDFTGGGIPALSVSSAAGREGPESRDGDGARSHALAYHPDFHRLLRRSPPGAPPSRHSTSVGSSPRFHKRVRRDNSGGDPRTPRAVDVVRNIPYSLA